MFNQNYNRQEFLRIFQTKICPDFVHDMRPLECSRQTKFMKDGIHQLGTIKFADDEVSVLEIQQVSGKDPRITLTKDAFKLLHDHQKDNALIIFRSENTKTWRLSLLTSKYEGWDKVNSNPKRYSFLLGEGEKTKTPEKYLIDKGIIKNFDELVNRFDVEVVRKEFFKLYMNLFLELYGEIQNNPTFHVLIEQKKIEPVSFAKNLMGKMIFLYFIQKKGRLGITDKSKNFGEGDHDFFRNNFDKLAHDADLFQKRMNFYNDFLEPLFYSGLNKKNDNDRHSKLNMKVPYLNGGLFQEEYDRKNTIINLDNELFKNIIRSFDTYNFTIDEDDAHDREIAVDPEMLGKIFESMISVSKDNIDQIIEVYRDAKEKKHIIHPNPESILNIDIGKEINKKFGAFYTPREIVHYMTKESLVAYLANKLHEKNNNKSDKDIEAVVRKLFEYKDKHLTKQEIESEKSDGYELLKKYVFDIQESLKSLKILDPAVGSGAFPMGILQEILGLRRYLIDVFELKSESDFEIKKQIVQNSIYGVDIDPGAIDIARLRFRLSLIVDATEPMPLPNLDFKFVCANSLIPIEKNNSLFTASDIIFNLKELRLKYFDCSSLEEKDKLKREFDTLKLELSGFGQKRKSEFVSTKAWKEYIETLVKQNTDTKNRQIMEREPFDVNKSNGWFDRQMMFGIEGFDIIIGNPPYVSVKGIKDYDKKRFSEIFETGKGRFNLFTLFLEFGHKLLSTGGIMTYILPDGLFSHIEYSHIRRYLMNKSNVLRINTFDNQVFENASVDTGIIIITNKTNKNNFIKVSKNLYEEIGILSQDDILNTQDFLIAVNQNQEDISLISKLDKGNVRIVEKILEIQQGIIYSGQAKEDVFSNERIDNDWKKILDGRDVVRYRINYDIKNENKYIHYTKKLHRPREDRLFLAPEKILLPRRSTNINCAYDNEQYYVLNTAYICLLKDSEYNLKYLISLLNSSLIDFYYKKKFLGWQITIPALNNIPIKHISLASQKPFITIVNQILDKKKGNPGADTSELEKKIDQMVYELYGLTEEEIKVVEESVGK